MTAPNEAARAAQLDQARARVAMAEERLTDIQRKLTIGARGMSRRKLDVNLQLARDARKNLMRERRALRDLEKKGT